MKKKEPMKIKGSSLDIAAKNREQLKQLFPSVFTETINDDGELVESIDFEKLKAELGTFTDLFESRRERYGIDWPGKRDALRLIQTPSYATLKPCREESINFDTTENLFIEGDNLEVLKLLQKSYYSKVKMIYIDPPYNTGKQFIYPDNYSESLETYLEYAGLIDGDGKKFLANTPNEGRFHTKWLNMLYPRLYLARNLLRDDGVIFISIADEEIRNLRSLLDDVFGEENFVATIIWKKKTNGNNMGLIPPVHDYIVCYGKNLELINEDVFGYELTEEQIRKNYSNPDNDSRGPWDTMDLSANHKGPYFKITNPNTGKEFYPPRGRYWVFNEQEVVKRISEGRIIFGRKGMTAPVQKVFLSERKVRRQKPESWWDKHGLNQDGTEELTAIFGTPKIFDHSKPTKLLINILEIATNPGDIVLDFFAGSGSFAHAVATINSNSDRNLKFVVVQLPEPCVEDSEALKAGYETIADIAKARIRKAIKILNDGDEDSDGSEGLRNKTNGFRLLKLAQSNFKQWQKLEAQSTTPEQIEGQLDMHVNHINHVASQEDLLFEILLNAGFQPTEKYDQLEIVEKKVYSVAEGALLVCLENSINKELIDHVIETNPQQFICLDSAFNGNDQLKANAVQSFAARNMQKEKHNQIVFRTV